MYILICLNEMQKYMHHFMEINIIQYEIILFRDFLNTK